MRQLCRDFGNENEPKYEAAHVYFTSNAKDAVLFSIKTVTMPNARPPKTFHPPILFPSFLPSSLTPDP